MEEAGQEDNLYFLMKLEPLKYYKGLKYQVAEDWFVPIDLYPYEATSEYYDVRHDGLLIKSGAAWDGASGPTKDSSKSKRASCFHDYFYMAIREGELPMHWRPRADLKFYQILRFDKMWFPRARLWFRGVRLFAGRFAVTGKTRKVYVAPRERS